VADGNWFCDPDNPDKTDNGFGNFNSILTVKHDGIIKYPRIYTIKKYDTSFFVTSNINIENYVVLWQNKELGSDSYIINNNKLMVTIPEEASKQKRSFIRIWGYNEAGYSNDLLIPLEYGNVFFETSKLTRNDLEASIMYFILTDRFLNGNPSNDDPILEEGVNAKLNYYGGDIRGIINKIKDNYLPSLGINSLWISPLSQNPTHAETKDGQKYTGYHGYWPTVSTRIDHRMGKRSDLFELVEKAHEQKINIILDYVSNHVHRENIVYEKNKDWATPLYLPDGSKNIKRWEEHRLTTWFDEFLPTLDYSNPEVIDTMTEFALFWIYNYDLDGFRHDATKHIQYEFWRKLSKKLKKVVMFKRNKRLYQIGETFGGRDLINSYIGSGMLDGQFSFNVYYEMRAAFAKDNKSFKNLATALKQDLEKFGYHNLMGYITGNHDLP